MNVEGAAEYGPAMLAGISELWRGFENLEALGVMIMC